MCRFSKGFRLSSIGKLVALVVFLLLIFPLALFSVNPASLTKASKQAQKVKYYPKLANYGIRSITHTDLALASKADNITALLEYERNLGNITDVQVFRYYKGFSSFDKGDELLLHCLQNRACNVEKYMSQLKRTNSVAKVSAGTATESGKVIGGNSAVLASRIGTKPGYAAHHIIPVELKNHRALQKIGMDLDEASNGISLPRFPGVDPKLPVHSGSHPAYTAAVKKELDAIPDNLSVEETRKRVNAIQERFRKKLESGQPLHANAGGTW